MPLALFQAPSLEAYGSNKHDALRIDSWFNPNLQADYYADTETTQVHKCALFYFLFFLLYFFFFFSNNLLDVQWMKWQGVCLHVWAQNLIGTSWNFDVIDKRSCSPNPNGTIPYDPLCTDLLRIKETEFCPRQWEMY